MEYGIIDDSKIGEKLLYLRKSYNLTQNDVSKLLDLKLSTYKHYEVGDRSVPIYTLIKIAMLYKIKVDFFFNSEYKTKKVEEEKELAKDLQEMLEDAMKRIGDVKLPIDKNKINFNIRLNIKTLRIKFKKTQQDIADVLGIDVSTYNKYENGRRKLGNEILSKLAEFYNCSVNDFIK
jgi:transcriptional regulator with XRE-family HTH domain